MEDSNRYIIDDLKRYLAVYQKINLDLHRQIYAQIKALRKIQGADNLTDCHRIAERILNEKNYG